MGRSLERVHAFFSCLILSCAMLVGCIPGGDNPAPPPDNERALLASLEVSTTGASSSASPALSPPFDPKVVTYTVTVPNSVTAVTIRAALADVQRSILKINNQNVPSGDPYVIDNLKVGAALPVVLLVEETVPGGVTRSYTITVTRSASPLADLAALSVSAAALSPRFDPSVTGYTVKTGNSTSSTTLTATPAEPTAQISVNGQAAISGQPFGPVSLALGPNPFTITVSPPGGTAKQYSVVVIRGASGVADLAALEVSAGALSPAFSPDISSYSVQTDNATTQTTVTALLADASAQLTINGQAVSSGQPSGPIPLIIGDSTVAIDVRAQDGTTRSYSVKISRPQSSNNNLSALSVSAGALDPGFAPTTTSYSVTVLSTVASTTLTASVQDPTATIAINGTTVQSGETFGPLSLNVGANEFRIVVTAQDGSVKTYVVTITRTANANLASLALSAGPLSPGFDSGTTSYAVSAPNANATTTVTATLADATSTLTINGQVVASGQVFGPLPLNVGGNTITLVVTAAGGAASKTYTVAVTRAASSNADLAGLVVSPGVMLPLFTPSNTAYTVTGTGLFTPSVTVMATVADATAALSINGQVVPSGPPGLAVLINIGVTSFPIQVRAQDGVTVKTYIVTVTRP
ncbi:hypothetical protein YTPLAS18_33390 [Nitrospira sp.]|nr:hypothetical protein YTPLAS18_33390 [Nitrospira sp.]